MQGLFYHWKRYAGMVFLTIFAVDKEACEQLFETMQEPRTSTYTIARIPLTIEMDRHDSLWEAMDNYRPFLYDGREAPADVAFKLSVVDRLNDTPCRLLSSRRNPENGADNMDIYLGEDGLYRFDLFQAGTCKAVVHTHPPFHTAEAVFEGCLEERHQALNCAVMLCYMLAATGRNALLIHASVVVNNGRGYVFLGKSGTGKSTHSHLWLQHVEGSTLLNDDNPVVGITDSEIRIYGSPWSGKTACYRNIGVPIAAFVRLKQAGSNLLHRLTPAESYASLLASSGTAFGIGNLNGQKARLLSQLAEACPCMLMECRPDQEAAQLCSQQLECRP